MKVFPIAAVASDNSRCWQVNVVHVMAEVSFLLMLIDEWLQMRKIMYLHYNYRNYTVYSLSSILHYSNYHDIKYLSVIERTQATTTVYIW